jgi:predicted TIM-barrel fold metal-dependent hydrolase
LPRGRTMKRAWPAGPALRHSARCEGSDFKSPRRGALYAVLLPALVVMANAIAVMAAPPVPEAGSGGQAATRGAAPVVDAHMHVWSDQPDSFPFAHPFEPKVKPPRLAATVELLVDEMDRSGVTHCVLVQVIYHGWDNRYLAQCLKSYPKRFRGQGLIDPTDLQAAKKLEFWVKEHGLSGMRLSPMYYRDKDGWLNAESSNSLWQKAEELGAIFNFFLVAQQLPKLEDMVRRFPKVRVVIDHLARVNLEASDPQAEIRQLLALARYPNVWVKVSELSVLSPSKTYPYRDTFDLVKQVYQAFGPDRLLWGTGFPGATRAEAGRPSLRQELDLINKDMPFITAQDRAKILGRNAAKLWGFEAP